MDGYEIWHCPKCKVSFYRDGATSTTLMDYNPVYKDGKLLNQNPNIQKWVRCCLNCCTNFSMRLQLGELTQQEIFAGD